MLRSYRQFLGRCRFGTLSIQRCYSTRKVQEHDVLFLRQQGAKFARWHLTAPIRADSRVKLSYGASLEGADLIGRSVLDRVVDSKGNGVVVHEPTVASYIINSGERLATPILPHDCNSIVSLLDLSPSRPGEDEEVLLEDDQGESDKVVQPFEIFEAGTGMGSLTLHIARAIHGGNPPLARNLRQVLCGVHYQRDREGTNPPSLQLEDADREALDSFKRSRRYVLHTLDRNPKHTRAAHKLIRNFRRAQYLSDIDFHCGSVAEYISRRLEESEGRPFLSRAVLDMPSPQDHAEHLVQALHTDAILIVFNPSLSQIAEFHAWTMETRQPIRLEKVLELPNTTITDGVHDGSCGGRHWNLKTVLPKAVQRDGDAADSKTDQKLVQVMRPKVGDRVGGGGFIAVLRRWPNDDSSALQTMTETELEEATEHLTER